MSPADDHSTSADPSSDDIQFEDYQGPLTPPTRLVRAPALLNPATLRGVAAFVAGIVIIVRGASPTAIALAIGAVVVAWGLAEALQARGADRPVVSLARGLGLIALGVVLIVWPGVTARVLGRVLGAALVAMGVIRAYRTATDRDPSANRFWGFAAAAFTVAVGVAVLAVPETLLELVLLILAVYFVVSGIITVVTNIRADTDSQITLSDSWPAFWDWLQGRAHTADDRRQLYEKLFFEGPDASRRLSRFFILMGFATTIAAYGIVSDSTAVVIGAMLIAPLMTPLMATSVSMTMGWPKRATLSGAVALGGILFAIGLSMLFGGALPFEVDPVTNAQVASRISPTLVDLIIAIAAGGAGAFALSRPDVSDALPGVAVAIALVPPLAVVGLMLAEGAFHDAFGALLLFTTNLVAILLTGGVVFILTGVVPIRRLSQNAQWVRTTVTTVGIAAVAVLVLLSVSGEDIRSQAFDQAEARQVAEEWVAGTQLTVQTVDVSRSEVTVVVFGPDQPPPLDTLASSLADAFGSPIDIVVDWVPQQRLEFPAGN